MRPKTVLLRRPILSDERLFRWARQIAMDFRGVFVKVGGKGGQRRTTAKGSQFL
ncbi:hypothetical protein P3T21_005596 [Paraburkholderia sp. GAS334]